MSIALTTDILIQSVGKRVTNASGTKLGKIIEITRGSSGSSIEYAILKSDNNERHYAIPVSSRLIKITKAGQIVLHVSNEDLQLANGVHQDKCPTPNFQATPSVFELIEYKEPKF